MSNDEFTIEVVKDFMLENGGRVTNHQLVTRFRKFLNDPEERTTNREKFKDYVNTLVTIKFDERNEKILVLKKKFRPETTIVPAPDENANIPRAQSEPPPPKPSQEEDIPDGGGMSKVKSDGDIDKPKADPPKVTISVTSVNGSEGTLSTSSSGASGSTSGFEDDGNVSVVSVKDRALHLNRMESETELKKSSSYVKLQNAKNTSKSSRDDDDESQTSGISYVTYDSEEKEWLVTSSSADYHPIAKMLSKSPNLAKIKDFTNGYTGLHWAAKHGKPEVIKLIAPKPGVNVNHRSHGGYTALHIAAMHGNENIIELLVSTYKADANIRDHSGKKAKQYLKNSASTRAQQLLVSRKLGGTQGSVNMRVMDDSFLRSTSFRRSNRTTAITSLLQVSGAGSKQSEMLRSSWSGSSEYINKGIKPGDTPPSSAGASPRPLRREYSSEQQLKPPFSSNVRRKKSSSNKNTEPEFKVPASVPRSDSEPNLKLEETVNAKATYV